MIAFRSVISFQKLGLALLLAVTTGVAADRPVGLNRNGANIARVRARPGDRIVWSGNAWRAEFRDRTPCQNGKRLFTSTEAPAARVCVISVTCSASNNSGCGIYKYHSAADGGPLIDPEIEVDPSN